jgi:hypothetical protein
MGDEAKRDAICTSAVCTSGEPMSPFCSRDKPYRARREVGVFSRATAGSLSPMRVFHTSTARRRSKTYTQTGPLLTYERRVTESRTKTHSAKESASSPKSSYSVSGSVSVSNSICLSLTICLEGQTWLPPSIKARKKYEPQSWLPGCAVRCQIDGSGHGS